MSTTISSLADLQSEVAIHLFKASDNGAGVPAQRQAEVFYIRYFSYINIKSEELENESFQVLLKDVMYLEILDEEHLLIHVHSNVSILLQTTIQSLFGFLQRYYFLKISSLCYVNIVYISGLQSTGQDVELDDGTQLSVASIYREEITKAIKLFYTI